MPLNLSKVQKKITKKKGRTTSLHENSRDAQKLRRAGARSEKLEKLSAARSRAHEPLLQRISFFRTAALATNSPLPLPKIQSLIETYLTRDAPLLSELQSARRPGRPSSTKEDLLKQRIETEEREYGSGYWVPDMGDEGSLEMLRLWKGEWSGLGRVRFVRVRRDGEVRGSEWPPNGGS